MPAGPLVEAHHLLVEAAFGLWKLGFHVDEVMISVDYNVQGDARREIAFSVARARNVDGRVP